MTPGTDPNADPNASAGADAGTDPNVGAGADASAAPNVGAGADASAAPNVGAVRPGRPGSAERAGSAERLGRAGLAAIAASLLSFLFTALLGPSAFEPFLAADPGLPPYSLNAEPSPYLVIGLVVLGVLAGTAGLGACFVAVRRGWTCRTRPLVVAGLLAAVAFVFMPPLGSTDHLNYAAYGRMVVLGHDPYETGASKVPGDPVIGAAEEWRDTPSVYGPLTTAGQALASWVGGDSVRLTVFVLSVLNVLAFALTALLLHRTARDDRARLRAALLWTANPLMIFHLVAGAHNDVLAVAPMVAALTVFRAGIGGALATGVLVGVGAAVKLPAALVGGGPAWNLLRATRGRDRALRLAVLVGGAAVTAGLAFWAAGPHALDQVRNASGMISFATPWHLVDLVLPRSFVKVAWVLLMLALLWLLYRALPGERDEPRRVAAALVLAWLFAAPYELPWYDGFGWAVLALLAWSRFDWLLLAHTAVLSLAYLPARDPKLIGLPGWLEWFLPSVLRSVIAPVLLTGVLAVLVRWCLRARRSPASATPPPAPADR
ncbi:polyprenol phosphomannose-dependent alpha 1,6 mannosyltransferase MptB [Actinomadura hibisca]|uniref:polyprenol phosphomannose-dependent alpha 1,6 mannosyltransferase MptB n=1 Tax=Actinomadura hibisca TaxID=68565 RepID=UPI0012FB4198|nr:polyprenol phosphomannose-dependent alpha 1,6 mannosyltransferase MptB [Actinomadura hibisca]